MDDKLKADLKTKLQAEKEKTIEELSTVSDPDKGEHVAGNYDPKFPDYGENTSDEPGESPIEVEDYEVNVDVTNKLQTKLNTIDEALKKMESGEYGVCEKCNKEISLDRLQVSPAALTCVECG